jgi:rhodanese-related sulfurtransferase
MAHKQHSPRFLALVEDARGEIEQCTVHDVKRRMDAADPFTFIDVREESEFAADHARGAVHLGKGILERDIEKLVPNPDAPIVLYCGGGFRSALSAHSLEKMGYTRVISMDGGITAWREAGYPLEK